MHEHSSESEALRVKLSCDAQSKWWYCTVSRRYSKKISRINAVYNSRMLFREYLRFELVVGFVGFSSRGVSRHTVMDITSLTASLLREILDRSALSHYRHTLMGETVIYVLQCPLLKRTQITPGTRDTAIIDVVPSPPSC
jgi:hypothetical protein